MEISRKKLVCRWVWGVLAVLIVAFFVWQVTKKPPLTGNWQPALAVLSTADIRGDLVTVYNVRNFTYNGSEDKPNVAYYDKTYDLRKLKRVWYLDDPFSGLKLAAHTFVSFEFSNGDFLSITIEARKEKGQEYNLFLGMLNTYPLMYIAADERDSLYVRANIRKDNLYMYPVKLRDPNNARLLLVDMLEKMNKISTDPEWYNTLTKNCTSQIAYHINKLFPGRLPSFAWQTQLSGYADELALKSGLLDTNLPLDQARQKYYITKRSQEVGYVPNYSTQIRNFDAK